MRRAACIVFAVVVLLWLGAAPGWGQRVQKKSVRGKKAPLSRALRDLPVTSAEKIANPVARTRRQFPAARKGRPGYAVDPAAQTEFGVLAPTFAGVNFEGMGEGLPLYAVNVAPPDTDGEVGRTQYVQIVNSTVIVLDKVTQAILAGPTDTYQLWASLANNPCGELANNDGDGIVVYDQFADRWIISQFARAGNNNSPWYECVAVSQTGDAAGPYFLYFFSYNEFPDYPKMGVWPDGYYVTYNTFTSPIGTGTGGKYCALDRERMLEGRMPRGVAGPAGGGPSLPAGNNQICFNTPDYGVLPADVDGSTPPPLGSLNYGVEWYFTDPNNNLSFLGLWRFHVDWNIPTNSTLNGVSFVSDGVPAHNSSLWNDSPILIAVDVFTPTCNWLGGDGQICVPQQGTLQQLDTLTDRVMHRLPYRNFGTHESLLTNHTVDVSGRGGVRWYELRDPNGTPTVEQYGTWSPDTAWRWMASIAMDKFGNIALGYSKSSGTMKPAIAYATRLSTDTLGQLGNEEVVFAGTGAQTTNLDRWGDYSALSVDPQDDCTFWYTNQYLATDGTFNWHTRINSFRLAQCQSKPFNLSITPNIGSGLTADFSFLYSDTAGAGEIELAEGLVNATASTASACAFRYDHTAGTIALYQDNGVGFTATAIPGQAGTLSNSQCTLNVGLSSVGTAGNHLVVNVRLTFASPAFAGAKKMYMNVSDSGGTTTGWEQKGAWTVP